MHPLSHSGKTAFHARAILVGERIDLRSLSSAERLGTDPVTIVALPSFSGTGPWCCSTWRRWKKPTCCV
jgi:hypothetical protein